MKTYRVRLDSGDADVEYVQATDFHVGSDNELYLRGEDSNAVAVFAPGKWICITEHAPIVPNNYTITVTNPDINWNLTSVGNS